MHGHVWMRRTGLTVTVAVAIAQAHPAAAGAFPGETSVASVNSAGLAVPGGSGELPFISADGRYVAFFTPGAMTPEDANRRHDVFVRDRTMGLTERASVGNTVLDGNGFSADGSISDDGRFVAFASDSSNLVAGDTNASSDVFVRDRATGTTELVSRSSSGAQANRGAAGPVISGDGRHVAFVASATTPTSSSGTARPGRPRESASRRRASRPTTRATACRSARMGATSRSGRWPQRSPQATRR
jgi:hypothetical protein